MSLIRTGLALDDGQAQVINTTATVNGVAITSTPAQAMKHTHIPLTADGSAVRMASSPVAAATTQTIRADGTLTGSYVSATTVLDLANYNTVAIRAAVGTAQAGKVANLKFQWSFDNTNFSDEPANVEGAVSGTEIPYTPYSRRVDLAMDTAGASYIERLNRMARYLRVQAKSDGVTTGTLAITASRFNN